MQHQTAENNWYFLWLEQDQRCKLYSIIKHDWIKAAGPTFCHYGMIRNFI